MSLGLTFLERSLAASTIAFNLSSVIEDQNSSNDFNIFTCLSCKLRYGNTL
nr:MAG TPA: hypothetical protein [Caudoviricetes sp.]